MGGPPGNQMMSGPNPGNQMMGGPNNQMMGGPNGQMMGGPNSGNQMMGGPNPGNQMMGGPGNQMMPQRPQMGMNNQMPPQSMAGPGKFHSQTGKVMASLSTQVLICLKILLFNFHWEKVPKSF